MINSKSLRIIPKYPLLCGPNLLDPLTHPGRSLADWNSCSYLFHEPSPAILVLVTLSILLSSTLNAPFIPVRLPISYLFHSPFQWNPVDFCFISKIPEFGGFWWEWMRRKESKITRMDEWTSLSRGELSKHPSRNTWLSGIHHFFLFFRYQMSPVSNALAQDPPGRFGHHQHSADFRGSSGCLLLGHFLCFQSRALIVTCNQFLFQICRH